MPVVYVTVVSVNVPAYLFDAIGDSTGKRQVLGTNHFRSMLRVHHRISAVLVGGKIGYFCGAGALPNQPAAKSATFISPDSVKMICIRFPWPGGPIISSSNPAFFLHVCAADRQSG